jgi:hypothetical protein
MVTIDDSMQKGGKARRLEPALAARDGTQSLASDHPFKGDQGYKGRRGDPDKGDGIEGNAHSALYNPFMFAFGYGPVRILSLRWGDVASSRARRDRPSGKQSPCVQTWPIHLRQPA